jgi:hypothetical protein
MWDYSSQSFEKSEAGRGERAQMGQWHLFDSMRSERDLRLPGSYWLGSSYIDRSTSLCYRSMFQVRWYHPLNRTVLIADECALRSKQAETSVCIGDDATIANERSR